jgi:hypothetical protein
MNPKLGKSAILRYVLDGLIGALHRFLTHHHPRPPKKTFRMRFCTTLKRNVCNLHDLQENGGVFKEIIKAGDGWEKPEKGDKVMVHYVGTLEADGQEFDSSRGRGDPFTFTLGQGQVIKGWDIGVATMKKGELAKFTIKSDFAYGDSGSPPKSEFLFSISICLRFFSLFSQTSKQTTIHMCTTTSSCLSSAPCGYVPNNQHITFLSINFCVFRFFFFQFPAELRWSSRWSYSIGSP